MEAVTIVAAFFVHYDVCSSDFLPAFCKKLYREPPKELQTEEKQNR